MRTINITLGGVAHKAARLNLGQFLDLLDAEKDAGDSARDILQADADAVGLALEGAGMAADEAKKIVRSGSVSEMKAATRAILDATLSDLDEPPPGETPSP